MALGTSAGSSRTFGRYELVIEVSKSKLGALWVAATTPDEGERRALLLRRVAGLPPEALDAVEQAAGRAQAIQHPRLLPCVDVFRVGTELGIASEYVPAETLRSLLRLSSFKHKPIAAGVALRICLDVLHGMDALHTAAGGPFVGGLTPDSVLVGNDGNSRLFDAGLTTQSTNLEQIGRQADMIGYAAPEQLENVSDVRSDIFSVGVLLWEMLTGRRLFLGASFNAVADKVRACSVQRLDNMKPPGGETIPQAAADVAARALERNPEARFTRAKEMIAAIEASRLVAEPAQVTTLVENFAGTSIRARDNAVKRAVSDGTGGTGRASVVPRITPVANPALRSPSRSRPPTKPPPPPPLASSPPGRSLPPPPPPPRRSAGPPPPPPPRRSAAPTPLAAEAAELDDADALLEDDEPEAPTAVAAPPPEPPPSVEPPKATDPQSFAVPPQMADPPQVAEPAADRTPEPPEVEAASPPVAKPTESKTPAPPAAASAADKSIPTPPPEFSLPPLAPLPPPPIPPPVGAQASAAVSPTAAETEGPRHAHTQLLGTPAPVIDGLSAGSAGAPVFAEPSEHGPSSTSAAWSNAKRSLGPALERSRTLLTDKLGPFVQSLEKRYGRRKLIIGTSIAGLLVAIAIFAMVGSGSEDVTAEKPLGRDSDRVLEPSAPAAKAPEPEKPPEPPPPPAPPPAAEEPKAPEPEAKSEPEPAVEEPAKPATEAAEEPTSKSTTSAARSTSGTTKSSPPPKTTSTAKPKPKAPRKFTPKGI